MPMCTLRGPNVGFRAVKIAARLGSGERPGPSTAVSL
jgi:hypothetical protein